jgi:hypothetical protein
MRLGRFNITEGPARAVYRFAAGALAVMASIPAVYALVHYCHTLKVHDLVECVGWSCGPVWFGWIARTGLLFPERRRRKGDG